MRHEQLSLVENMRYELRVCDICGVISRERMIGEPHVGWSERDGLDMCAACMWEAECGEQPSIDARLGQKEIT